MQTIIFSATFLDDQITGLATGLGWSPMVWDGNGGEVENPESDLEYCKRLAKDNMVQFLTAPSIRAKIEEKTQEASEENALLISAIEQSIEVISNEV